MSGFGLNRYKNPRPALAEPGYYPAVRGADGAAPSQFSFLRPAHALPP